MEPARSTELPAITAHSSTVGHNAARPQRPRYRRGEGETMEGRVLAILAAVLLCTSIKVGAGVNEFTAMGPTGGAINKIVVCTTPNTGFTIASGGFFCSQDRGGSWQLGKTDFFSARSQPS